MSPFLFAPSIEPFGIKLREENKVKCINSADKQNSDTELIIV